MIFGDAIIFVLHSRNDFFHRDVAPIAASPYTTLFYLWLELRSESSSVLCVQPTLLILKLQPDIAFQEIFENTGFQDEVEDIFLCLIKASEGEILTCLQLSDHSSRQAYFVIESILLEEFVHYLVGIDLKLYTFYTGRVSFKLKISGVRT